MLCSIIRTMATNTSRRQLLLISSSQVHGHEYLQHSKDDIIAFFGKNNVNKVIFVPYAQPNYDAYTEKVANALKPFGIDVTGIHAAANPVVAIEEAQAIFIGGGNTFLLLRTLYDNELIRPIQRRVINDGIPYMGTSAGTNVATASIHTTNDMPIIEVPTFKALNLVPFNINPHYLDADVSSKHKGETRETRIMEFHGINETPVLGLREGCSLLVNGDQATLLGDFCSRLFRKNETPLEISPKTDVSFLLKD